MYVYNCKCGCVLYRLISAFADLNIHWTYEELWFRKHIFNLWMFFFYMDLLGISSRDVIRKDILGPEKCDRGMLLLRIIYVHDHGCARLLSSFNRTDRNCYWKSIINSVWLLTYTGRYPGRPTSVTTFQRILEILNSYSLALFIGDFLITSHGDILTSQATR